MLAGLALAYVSVHNLALTAGLFAPASPLSSSGPPLVFSILQIISLPVIQLGMMVGLFGLLVLLGVSSVVRWGVGLAAVAALLLIIELFVPFVFMIASHNASPSYDAIGALIFLSHAIPVLSSLVLAAGLMLLFVAARRDQKLGAWRVLLPAIAAVLSSTVPLALSAVGLMGSAVFSGVFQFVVGLLWVALGAAVWRHAPENQNIGTTPVIS
ncbi:MAG: hypothetical protein ICV31_03350 [Rubrobacter sp.]|nr:hypothetical protein [Rubrobacter sp.]